MGTLVNSTQTMQLSHLSSTLLNPLGSWPDGAWPFKNWISRSDTGRSNTNADALSRAPLEENDSSPQEEAEGVIANITGEEEVGLAARQRQDEELLPVIKVLETGLLPPDEAVAKKIAMTASQYTLEEGILYHVAVDGTLRLIPPTPQREMLFNQGAFGAHLSDCKVFSELGRHYWWCTMRSDITKWSRGCLVCTTREAGRAYRAPLTVRLTVLEATSSNFQGHARVINMQWSLWTILLSGPKFS